MFVEQHATIIGWCVRSKSALAVRLVLTSLDGCITGVTVAAIQRQRTKQGSCIDAGKELISCVFPPALLRQLKDTNNYT